MLLALRMQQGLVQTPTATHYGFETAPGDLRCRVIQPVNPLATPELTTKPVEASTCPDTEMQTLARVEMQPLKPATPIV